MARNLSIPAQKALYAVSIRSTCGHWAARRYAVKHGVLGLYRLALQLDAVRNLVAY